jgi:hypothetical protein
LRVAAAVPPSLEKVIGVVGIGVVLHRGKKVGIQKVHAPQPAMAEFLQSTVRVDQVSRRIRHGKPHRLSSARYALETLDGCLARLSSIPTSILISVESRSRRSRVTATRRGQDVVHVRSRLTPEQERQEFQTVRPGERVVTAGLVELKAILEDLTADRDR